MGKKLSRVASEDDKVNKVGIEANAIREYLEKHWSEYLPKVNTDKVSPNAVRPNRPSRKVHLHLKPVDGEIHPELMYFLNMRGYKRHLLKKEKHHHYVLKFILHDGDFIPEYQPKPSF